ncbi:hypothetical protein [Saccharopolyspora spinosa]|uniref:hypothetical protein n=1 Tax=Saccharopolyspora spinosa TaxID=60894 RepID=UPI00117A8355|nr:hypothetical protein [Saccharopolyspora spinosa]
MARQETASGYPIGVPRNPDTWRGARHGGAGVVVTSDFRQLGQMTRGVITALGLAVYDLEAGRYEAADRERLAGYLDNLAAALRADGNQCRFHSLPREYAEFCHRVAGRFIHHVPNDAPNALPGRGTSVEARARTVKAIQRAGFPVDGELWTDAAAKCSPGDAEDGCCAASGVDGNENTGNQTPPPVR